MGGNGLFDSQLLINVGNSQFSVGEKQIEDGNSDRMGDRSEGFGGIFEKVFTEVCFHGRKVVVRRYIYI